MKSSDKLQQTVAQLRERGKKILQGDARLYDIDRELRYTEVRAFGELLHSDKPLEVTDIDVKRLSILKYELMSHIYSNSTYSDSDPEPTDPEYPRILNGLSLDRAMELSSIIKKKAIELDIESTIMFFDPKAKAGGRFAIWEKIRSKEVQVMRRENLAKGWKVWNDLDKNNITESILSRENDDELSEFYNLLSDTDVVDGNLSDFCSFACYVCRKLDERTVVDQIIGDPLENISSERQMTFANEMGWLQKRICKYKFATENIELGEGVNKIGTKFTNEMINLFTLPELLKTSRACTVFDLQDMEPRRTLGEIIRDIWHGIIKLFEKILGQNRPVTHPYIGKEDMKKINQIVKSNFGEKSEIER